MKKIWMYAVAITLLSGVAGAYLLLPRGAGKPTGSPEAVELAPVRLLDEPIQPIPQTVSLNPDEVALGRKLFHDTRLSHDNTIACATCHSLTKGGTDQAAHSTGINGAIGGINAPTVLNSGLNFKQFWNGRAETLEAQVEGPTQHPKEMGSTWPEILGKLKDVPEYTAAFAKIFPDGIQKENVKSAIATFERSLITPNAPFDRYLRGDSGAISEQAKLGYRLFKEYGCVSCHQGANVGGNMFQKIGVMADYFAYRGNVTEADYGRYNVTKNERDRYVFRVPTLRNIALTTPYFHDGSTQTLDQAVEIMAKYQLGRPIDNSEVAPIVEFLKSLTGEVDGGPK